MKPQRKTRTQTFCIFQSLQSQYIQIPAFPVRNLLPWKLRERKQSWCFKIWTVRASSQKERSRWLYFVSLRAHKTTPTQPYCKMKCLEQNSCFQLQSYARNMQSSDFYLTLFIIELRNKYYILLLSMSQDSYKRLCAVVQNFAGNKNSSGYNSFPMNTNCFSLCFSGNLRPDTSTGC